MAKSHSAHKCTLGFALMELTSFVLAPLALFMGEGLGVRGFALCFDWILDREFNAPLVSFRKPKQITKPEACK